MPLFFLSAAKEGQVEKKTTATEQKKNSWTSSQTICFAQELTFPPWSAIWIKHDTAAPDGCQAEANLLIPTILYFSKISSIQQAFFVFYFLNSVYFLWPLNIRVFLFSSPREHYLRHVYIHMYRHPVPSDGYFSTLLLCFTYVFNPLHSPRTQIEVEKETYYNYHHENEIFQTTDC